MNLIRKKCSFSVLLLLMTGIGFAQCPDGQECYTRVHLSTYCLEDDSSILEVETDGSDIEWKVTNGDAENLTIKSYWQMEVRPLVRTTYSVRSRHLHANYIHNGSFDSDIQTFASDYTLGDKENFRSGNYAVVSDPALISSAFVSRHDHTGNGGNMLLIDGSLDTSMAFFIDTVSVSAGVSYQVSLYAANIHRRFANEDYVTGIIGIYLGEHQVHVVSMPKDTSWHYIAYSWVPENDGKQIIKLKSLDGRLKTNDFVVDDIYAGGYFFSEDSVVVEPCNTVNVFSPDNDGQMDTYYIKDSGIARIYNAQGKFIRELSIPALWDGRTETGEPAPTDYYSVIINENKVLHVTLIR